MEAELVGPTPALTPDQVVARQLDALQHHDVPYPDAGIEVAFAFTSPASKAAIGPLGRFAERVHHELYAPLLACASVQPGPLRLDGDRAEQEVLVVDVTDEAAAYAFLLSRQHSGPLAGCWMTDAVLRL
jgi:hypothetical protein